MTMRIDQHNIFLFRKTLILLFFRLPENKVYFYEVKIFIDEVNKGVCETNKPKFQRS
ncbi:MAG: hypothetical protein J6M43_06950 [Neisseriaceae bacterium]|nr:hypothetical protein [Neisseriaceae bacterium]